MSITILGSGNMAKGLASLFAKAGETVVVGTRNFGKAQEIEALFATNVSVQPIAAAAAASDIVVLAVPFAAVKNLLAEAGDLSGKTLIDITNPLTDDYAGLTIGHNTSAAEEIQKLAPQAKVVKAFNTLFAQVLQNRGIVAGKSATAFIAGDDDAANAAVERLATKGGLIVIQTGGLKLARYLEPVAGLNIALGYGRGHGTGIAPTFAGLV